MNIFSWFKRKPKDKSKRSFTYKIHEHVVEYEDGKNPDKKYYLEIIPSWKHFDKMIVWYVRPDGNLEFHNTFHIGFNSIEEVEEAVVNYKKYLHGLPISSTYSVVKSGEEIVS